jgi:hypothetical protein
MRMIGVSAASSANPSTITTARYVPVAARATAFSRSEHATVA